MLTLNLFQSLASSANPKNPCSEPSTDKQGLEYFMDRVKKSIAQFSMISSQ
jgi:hypothetical protein